MILFVLFSYAIYLGHFMIRFNRFIGFGFVKNNCMVYSFKFKLIKHLKADYFKW